jgi:hypothetical protein
VTALTFDREHDSVAAVVAKAQHNGWRGVPVRLGGERSLPGGSRLLNNDAIGFLYLPLIDPNSARIVAAELKTNTGRPTDRQMLWVRDPRAAGIETHGWRPSNWFDIDDALCNPLPLSVPLPTRRGRRNR